MSHLLAIPRMQGLSTGSHRNAVPPMYRAWARERIASLLGTLHPPIAGLSQALREGGQGIGGWMIQHSALPQVPDIHDQASEQVPHHVARQVEPQVRQGMATAARALIQAGLMKPTDLQADGKKVGASQVAEGIVAALCRRMEQQSLAALRHSPFTQCNWKPFQFEPKSMLHDDEAKHGLVIDMWVSDAIYMATPKFKDEQLQEAFRVATGELTLGSRHGLFVDSELTMEAIFPWAWEKITDLMVGATWDKDQPRFQRQRVAEFLEEWDGMAPGDMEDTDAQVTEDIVVVARHLREVARRKKTTRRYKQQIRQAIAHKRGQSAAMIRNLFTIADVLQSRARRPDNDEKAYIESDITHPCLFVIDPALEESGMIHYMMDGYGQEGAGFSLRANWENTLEFVELLDDVVLEATLLAEAASSIAYHD